MQETVTKGQQPKFMKGGEGKAYGRKYVQKQVCLVRGGAFVLCVDNAYD